SIFPTWPDSLRRSRRGRGEKPLPGRAVSRSERSDSPMATIPTKAAALALLMVAPPPAPAPPAVPAPPSATPSSPQAPPAPPRATREVIVVDGDGVATFDSDDEPIVVHSEHAGKRGFIGIRLMDLTPDLRAHFGAPRDAGVMVSEVDK